MEERTLKSPITDNLMALFKTLTQGDESVVMRDIASGSRLSADAFEEINRLIVEDDRDGVVLATGLGMATLVNMIIMVLRGIEMDDKKKLGVAAAIMQDVSASVLMAVIEALPEEEKEEPEKVTIQ